MYIIWWRHNMHNQYNYWKFWAGLIERILWRIYFRTISFKQKSWTSNLENIILKVNNTSLHTNLSNLCYCKGRNYLMRNKILKYYLWESLRVSHSHCLVYHFALVTLLPPSCFFFTCSILKNSSSSSGATLRLPSFRCQGPSLSSSMK